MIINNDMLIGMIYQRVLEAHNNDIFEITHGVGSSFDIDYIIRTLKTSKGITYIKKEELPFGWALRIGIYVTEI